MGPGNVGALLLLGTGGRSIIGLDLGGTAGAPFAPELPTEPDLATTILPAGDASAAFGDAAGDAAGDEVVDDGRDDEAPDA